MNIGVRKCSFKVESPPRTRVCKHVKVNEYANVEKNAHKWQYKAISNKRLYSKLFSFNIWSFKNNYLKMINVH